MGTWRGPWRAWPCLSILGWRRDPGGGATRPSQRKGIWLWRSSGRPPSRCRGRAGTERTAPGGPGMQPAARSSAEPSASSAQRPRGPQRVRAGAGWKPSVTDALLLWTEVKEATFFVHYQEKEGAEDRFNAEVTEFILFLPKLFFCLTHIRNRKALTFLSMLHPRPVLSGLQVSRKKQLLSSREAGLRAGDQLLKAFPQGTLPSACSPASTGGISSEGCSQSRRL